MSTRLSRSRVIAAGIASLATLTFLAGCATDPPIPTAPSVTPEVEPVFDGVVGRDWIQIPTETDALEDVYWVDYGVGALWALRDEGDRTDVLLTSTDAITWTEVPLGLPDDLRAYPTPYADDDRIVLAFGSGEPWIVIGDGDSWNVLTPDDISDPVISGTRKPVFMRVFDIAPIGDSLLFLFGTRYDDSQGLPCHCRSPLVLHPDGSTEWVAVEGSVLGQLDTFGGYTDSGANGRYRALRHLFPTDNGVLLVTSWSEGQGQEIRVLESSNGLDWEDRTPSSRFAGLTGPLAVVVGDERGWVTATMTRDSGDVTDPERLTLLASPDGIEWAPAFSSDLDEYPDIATVEVTDDGFFAFPFPRTTGDRDGADVLFSPDSIEWTTYSNALVNELPGGFTESLRVRSVVAVDGGLLVLTTEVDAPLWVSGTTAFTPAPELETEADTGEG